MDTHKQLEESLTQIDLLEKKLSESQEKESDLLRIMKSVESQIFLCKKNSIGQYVPIFSKGRIAERYNAHLIDPQYPDNLICIGSVIFPVFLSDGKLEFIVLMHRDITDRMKAREVLQNSEMRLNYLLSSSPVVIYSSKIVLPYDLTFISDNVSSLTGFVSLDFLNNKNLWSDHVHPDDRQKVIDELPLVLEKGSHIMEYRFRCKDESYIWIQGETKLTYDSHGNPLEIIGYWIDISRRKQADLKIIAAMKKAEESDRLKSDFLANMSHEVRTPLNSIIGFSELLSDSCFKEEEKNEFIQHIITNGNKLLTIISDIMDISMMESGVFKIRKSQVNVHEFVSNIMKQFSVQIEEKKLGIKLSLPANDEETIIIADADRLSQIFNNLISNALKFTVNGRIEIGYQPKAKMVEFYVKDTGIGIPTEYQDKIFERFRQVESGYTRQYSGSGLGLAITKNLAELMGGNIWFESEPGKGSGFYFTLPTHKSQEWP